MKISKVASHASRGEGAGFCFSSVLLALQTTLYILPKISLRQIEKDNLTHIEAAYKNKLPLYLNEQRHSHDCWLTSHVSPVPHASPICAGCQFHLFASRSRPAAAGALLLLGVHSICNSAFICLSTTLIYLLRVLGRLLFTHEERSPAV